ncbi:MAG TPA: hydrogenase maturation nickel metallochaperone HypA [Anaerolineales bacterium]|jgi:hydrogenase nickel incorporation protein HypA/HybF|nr:hydrogenase maturation nickel metallochaperone HypA [Anaerolineales bacterium]
MHELAITESVLKIAVEHARAAGASRITDVHLVIGQLSSFIDDSIQFYWEIICEGTPAEGAILRFRRVPAELHCLACEAHYGLNGDDLACPECGGTQIRVLAGEEFNLEAIDVEGDEEPVAASTGADG